MRLRVSAMIVRAMVIILTKSQNVTFGFFFLEHFKTNDYILELKIYFGNDNNRIIFKNRHGFKRIYFS